MNNLLTFIKTRSIGFWLPAAAALLALVQAFVYLAGFGNDVEKMSWTAFALPLCGAAAFAGLSVSKYTASYASAVLAACAFTAFLLFIQGQIIYLSDVFYGGVNASSIATLSGEFIVCTLFLLVCTGLAVAGIFMEQCKKENGNEKI